MKFFFKSLHLTSILNKSGILTFFASIFLICNVFGQNTGIVHKIDKVVKDHFNSGEFSGTILVANKKGILFKGAYGFGDRNANRELTIETPFYLASVSKQFTSSAALMLVQENKLALDDPITKYLDDLPTFCSSIKIRNLLNHTSGLPDYYNVIEVTPGFTNRDVLNFVRELDALAFVPGTQFVYSNTGYVLMSSIIQKISRQNFSTFLKERIFDPVGMKNSYVLDDITYRFTGKAIGYSKSGEEVDYNFRTTGAGGIYSTVYDLYLWDRALYRGKQVSKYLLTSEAFKPSKLRTTDSYGL